MPTFSTQVQYSERLKELELAINTLSDDTQNLGRIYIINNDNRNKKFILSIIEFLKEIRWLVPNEKGKNIPTIK